MDEKQTVGKQIGDWGRRWQLLWSEAPLEKRFFAAAELFCFPVSLLTVFGFLPLQIFCSHLRLPLPPVWSGAVLPVLLSAAIGYLTNYIAIEMLFKPYERNKLHPFSLLTGTYWQQGLVPRNKHAVGVELGKQMEQLLDPQQISTDLCNMAVGFVQDERIVTALCGQLQTLLRHHEDSIIAFLQPRLERSLTEILDQLITTEQLKRVWLADLAPILTAPENRRAVCDSLIGALDRKTPQLINLFKTMVRESAQEFLKQHIPFGLGSESLADGLVGNIDWDAVEDRLKQKLQEEESRRMIDAELLAAAERLKSWLDAPEAAEKMAAWTATLKTKLNFFLHDYLQAALPGITDNVICSEALWKWIQTELLPNFVPQLERLIRTRAAAEIHRKLLLADRISRAVDAQDVRSFHRMVNSIAAGHLGAIQVLGYVLGALIGAAQLLVR